MPQLTSDADQSGELVTAPARPDLSAWAALVVVWVFWGSTYLAIRVADRSIPPFAMAAVRYLIAGAVLYPFAWLGHRRRQAAAQPAAAGPPAPGRTPSRLAQWGGMAVVGTLLLAFGNGGVSYAEQTLPSGLAALLVASVPLWMALADRVINGQQIPLRGWIALVLGLAGIAILARPSGNGAVLPVLVVLGAGARVGLGSVLAGGLPAPASPLTGSAMEMLTGAIVLAGLAAATGELTHFDPAHVSTQSLLGVLYLIHPGVPVSRGALFLGARPTLATLLGGAVVIASVAILLINRAGSQPRPRTER